MMIVRSSIVILRVFDLRGEGTGEGSVVPNPKNIDAMEFMKHRHAGEAGGKEGVEDKAFTCCGES